MLFAGNFPPFGELGLHSPCIAPISPDGGASGDRRLKIGKALTRVGEGLMVENRLFRFQIDLRNVNSPYLVVNRLKIVLFIPDWVSCQHGSNRKHSIQCFLPHKYGQLGHC
jgi:hypothetical protein